VTCDAFEKGDVSAARLPSATGPVDVSVMIAPWL
jgi:hypothetical protein